jgi:hypothetical protein
MREDLYQNSKICEPKGLSSEAVRQYYWEQGFNMAVENFTVNNSTKSCDKCKRVDKSWCDKASANMYKNCTGFVA